MHVYADRTEKLTNSQLCGNDRILYDQVTTPSGNFFVAKAKESLSHSTTQVSPLVDDYRATSEK